MKLTNNLYLCGFCLEKIHYTKKKSTAPKGQTGRKHAVSSCLKCQNCGRNVSQK